ncbi:MAG: thioesterase domain-containing protein [Verrucomicrobiota bacterium]
MNTNGKIDTKALPAPGTDAALEPSPAQVSDDIEERLTDLWEKTLKVNPIGLDEDFFALGGHSLLGMKLFSRIQREFDLSLPLSVLFKHPTVRLLGSEISRRIEAGEAVIQSPLSHRDDSPPEEGSAALAKSDRARTSHPIIHTPPRGLAETTVLLQPEGRETALFGVHGGDGGIFFYRDLAAHLEKNRPFYAFEAANLTNRGEVQVESVEGMAARYIAELRKVQPEGPYFLCGYSFGGIVAFEMACQLQQAGAEIGFLGIIDVNNPAADPRPRSISERVAMTWKGPDEERSTWLCKATRLGGRITRGLGYRIQADSQWLAAKTLPSAKNTGWLRLAQVRRANTIAQENYTQPSVFHGEVSLFRAMEGNDKHDLGDTYGWERIVQ